METLIGEGAFDSTVRRQINANFTELYAALIMGGRSVYVNSHYGSDNGDGSQSRPYRTLDQGYSALRDGYNDTLILVGDGTTNASARLSGPFIWSKNAAHLVGVSSGVNISNRSRIAPLAAVTAFANFFTVTGAGCRFANVQWFQGFDTGVAAEIALIITGGRNKFDLCHFAGMGDTVGAHDTGSRCLLVNGTGENQFDRCTIGIDTIPRDVANACIEFAGGTPRNVFKDCQMIMQATGAGALGIIVAGAAGSDRFQLFDRLTVLNAIKSGSGTAITGLATLAASMGGLLAFTDPKCVGVTAYGSDATSKAQIYVVGPANSTSTGIGANPA